MEIKSAEKKNAIVYFVTDDLGNDLLSEKLNGGVFPSQSVFPQLNFLESIPHRYTFYTQPACSQTRASFYTGKVPLEHGIGEVLEVGEAGIDQILIRSHLNYCFLNKKIIVIGKWHLGLEYPENGITCFDHFSGTLSNTGDFFDYSRWNWISSDNNHVPPTTKKYINRYILKELKRALELYKDEDVVIIVNSLTPHDPPHTPPPKWRRSETGMDMLLMCESTDLLLERCHQAISNVFNIDYMRVFSDNGTTKVWNQAPTGRGKGTLGEGGIKTTLFSSHEMPDKIYSVNTILQTPKDGISKSVTIPHVVQKFSPNHESRFSELDLLRVGCIAPLVLGGGLLLKYEFRKGTLGNINESWYIVNKFDFSEIEVSDPLSLTGVDESLIELMKNVAFIGVQ